MHRSIPVAGLAIAILTACATTPAPGTVYEEVRQGRYNSISGRLSDGTEVTGQAWYVSQLWGGDFCLQAGDMVCSGAFTGAADLTISGRFSCSNGVTGTYESDRIEDGDLIAPVRARGTLSDGRRANVTFSPTRDGRFSTRCLAQGG